MNYLKLTSLIFNFFSSIGKPVFFHSVPQRKFDSIPGHKEVA